MRIYSTSERTRQALINAAGELLAERGVGRVSTRAIAERAGENLGTIHYHFGGKDGLLKEVLRYACHSQVGPSLPEQMKAYEDRLDCVDVQVETVQMIIRHLMQETFSPERPRWCSRALYQVAQHNSPLRSFLRDQMLDPFFDSLTGVIRRIRPDWSAHEIQIWFNMLLGPIVFHADHGQIILEHLDESSFPSDYLARLEMRLLSDALRALGLDMPPQAKSGNGRTCKEAVSNEMKHEV